MNTLYFKIENSYSTLITARAQLKWKIP